MLEWLQAWPVWREKAVREKTITIINTGEKQMGGHSNPAQTDQGKIVSTAVKMKYST